MAIEKITVSEALDRIHHRVLLLPLESLSIDAAIEGRILGAPIVAAADTPRFDCSAMDGFALCARETAEATHGVAITLRLTDDIPANLCPPPLAPGCAAPISTGARIPLGADAVVAKERCRRVGDFLEIEEPVMAGRNVRARGEDTMAGARVAEAGERLSPERIGALLSYGVLLAKVRRRPIVDILSTGSEILAPSGTANSERLDSNGPMIAAMCRSLGLDYKLSAPTPDNIDCLRHRIASETARRADMIVSTGGVSAGEHDLVRRTLEALGAEIIFHGIAMRPGKPILFAILPNGTPFFGLPGNPVAALVGFRFFAMAAIRAMLGLSRETGTAMAVPETARRGTALFLRAHRSPTSGEVAIARDQRSHVLGSVVASNCWVLADEDGSEPRATLFDLAVSLER